MEIIIILMEIVIIIVIMEMDSDSVGFVLVFLFFSSVLVIILSSKEQTSVQGPTLRYFIHNYETTVNKSKLPRVSAVYIHFYTS